MSAVIDLRSPLAAAAVLTPQPARNNCALVAQAARLWPDDERNRREWLRAVMVVRRTRAGWLIERKTGRVNA